MEKDNSSSHLACLLPPSFLANAKFCLLACVLSHSCSAHSLSPHRRGSTSCISCSLWEIHLESWGAVSLFQFTWKSNLSLQLLEQLSGFSSSLDLGDCLHKQPLVRNFIPVVGLPLPAVLLLLLIGFDWHQQLHYKRTLAFWHKIQCFF